MVRIKEIRKELLLTQKQFAEKIEVDAHNVGDWERGKCEPSNDMLVKIANEFDVSVDYLLGRETDYVGTMKPSQLTDHTSLLDSEKLSSSEKNLIKNFRKLDVYQQSAIEIQITALAEQTEKIKK